MAIVRLSHLADGDLDFIRDYIFAHNRAAANDVLENLFNALELTRGEPRNRRAAR